MAYNLCANPCGVNLVLPDTFTECVPLMLNVEPGGLYFATCDQVFANLLQPAWDAAKTADKLIKMPDGLIKLTPTQGQKIKIKCNQYTPGNTTWTIEYESYSMSEGIEMYEYYQKVFEKNAFLSVFWPSCNNLWFLNPAWVTYQNLGAVPASEPTGEQIGYPCSMIEPPSIIQDEANELSKWVMKLEFKYTGVLVPCELPGIAI